MKLTLGTSSEDRKNTPLHSGCYAYFPAALAGVARHSKRGNDKHNPGEPLHHARGKSMDHADCIARHLADITDILAYVERDKFAVKGMFENALLNEANALAWRALALSQSLHERFGEAPLAPAASEPACLGAVNVGTPTNGPSYETAGFSKPHWVTLAKDRLEAANVGQTAGQATAYGGGIKPDPRWNICMRRWES